MLFAQNELERGARLALLPELVNGGDGRQARRLTGRK